MRIVIRKAGKQDFGAITELFKQLWPNKAQNRENLMLVFRRMSASDSYELLCAEMNGRVVGFASCIIEQNFWLEGLYMYVTTIIVDEKHRRNGVGKLFIGCFTKIARKMGCKKIELDSAFHRAGAHKFYKKMGFEKRAYLFSKDILQN